MKWTVVIGQGQGIIVRKINIKNPITCATYNILFRHLVVKSYISTFRYIINNSRFGDFVDRIYPNELEIKDTTDTDRSVSYLDLHLEINSEWRLRMKLYDKWGISIFLLWTIHLYVATFQQRLHMDVYLSVDLVFQNLWFLWGFPWKRVTANRDAT
jgi:hypothetical protein